MAEINAQLVQSHLTVIRIGLKKLMERQKQAKTGADDVDLSEPGLMVLQPDHERKIMNIIWVSVSDIPESEHDVRNMAAQCRPGDCSKMTILIPHTDGGYSVYLMSPLVSWHQFSDHFAVLNEAHYRARPPAPQLFEDATPEPLGDLFSEL